MDNYMVVVDGLERLDDIGSLPENVLKKARQAINATVKRTRTAAAREIQQQIAFPARYLVNQQGGRLFISDYATGKDLRAIIRGRERPTSLARFAKTGSPEAARRAGGVNVEVSPGNRKFMKKAFLMRLRAGQASTDTSHNLGLAMRLKDGQLTNKKHLVKIGKGLYVLYGPSVNQAFHSVADDVSPDALDYLEREFTRLLDL